MRSGNPKAMHDEGHVAYCNPLNQSGLEPEDKSITKEKSKL